MRNKSLFLNCNGYNPIWQMLLYEQGLERKKVIGNTKQDK
jgi:hypothetical protein